VFLTYLLALPVHCLFPSRITAQGAYFHAFYAVIMPPKRAKQGTNSQIQQAIVNTQAASQKPDAETQVDANTQIDDDPSSTDNSQVIDDAMASTADGAATSTADTTLTSAADETEAQPKPADKRPAGKTVAPATDTKDGEAKKKRHRKPDYSTFSVYIWKGLRIFLIFMLFVY
jgi:hypothetical protein